MDSEIDLILKDTVNGKGVFAIRDFKARDTILEFKGKIFDYDEIEKDSYIDEHCFQVGKRTYLGPSGGFDDFINHSCDPNSGLQERDGKFFLIAIKDIKLNEEIYWDYSTYIDEQDYFMTCSCGSKICRKKIGSFKDLPEDIKQRYIELKIVAPYFLEL